MILTATLSVLVIVCAIAIAWPERWLEPVFDWFAGRRERALRRELDRVNGCGSGEKSAHPEAETGRMWEHD